MESKYTPQQVEDIKEREAKGLAYLKELELTPAAQVYKQNLGNDVFVDKIVPFLQDIKYQAKDETSKKSPKESEKPVEPVKSGN